MPANPTCSRTRRFSFFFSNLKNKTSKFQRIPNVFFHCFFSNHNYKKNNVRNLSTKSIDDACNPHLLTICIVKNEISTFPHYTKLQFHCISFLVLLICFRLFPIFFSNLNYAASKFQKNPNVFFKSQS